MRSVLFQNFKPFSQSILKIRPSDFTLCKKAADRIRTCDLIITKETESYINQVLTRLPSPPSSPTIRTLLYDFVR